MVVIDASVAFKWFGSGEKHREQALQILHAHLTKKEAIYAPDLLLYELANAWATKSQLPAKRMALYLKDLQDSQLHLARVSTALLQKAIMFSKQYHVSVYDAAYAELAKEKGCILFTADVKFQEQVKLSFIKNLTEYTA
ncbi:MAG: type II toxin-antitoxin system VapC family toxin [Candidatus Levybacteria bacterium]|nr:type II toxin-antitoxin system VapC family toxin [Candidatus Levybacteria bacterium]